MSTLRALIENITAFGLNPKVELNNKTNVLKRLLVEIYSEFLNVKFEFEESEYNEASDFDYNTIRLNVQSNFPDFGLYPIVLDSNTIESNTETGYGDESDDLSDIIIDLLSVKWRMENTSENDALWHFEFLMLTHSEQHVVDLLKRLKERN